MDRDRHQRVMALLREVEQLTGAERDRRLAALIAADPEVGREVEARLADEDGATLSATAASVPLFHDDEATLASVTTLSGAPPRRAHVLPEVPGYRLVRRIGEGGMGVVYEAEQTGVGRLVALKLIRPGLSSPETVRRFRQEARILGQLKHPGIAPIFDAGEARIDGMPIPYFCMELVHGCSLREWADTVAPDVTTRLSLMALVCDAIHYAHEQGVIHRDLKPSNILVEPSGVPRVLDFGVARLTDPEAQRTTLATDASMLVGTVPYMSPEQASGRSAELDARADVYALGVVTYELLAGRLPHVFRGKYIHESLRMICEADPEPLSTTAPELRGDVETIVFKALAKEPERRYQSALEMANDIRRFLSDHPILARPPELTYQLGKFARRNRVFVASLASAFLVLLISVGFLVAQNRQILAQNETVRRARDAATVEQRRAEEARAEEARHRRAAEKAREDEARQREEAEQRRRSADGLLRFLAGVLSSVDLSSGAGPEITLLAALDRQSPKVDRAFADLPVDCSHIHRIFGSVYRALGALDQSERHLERCVDLVLATPSCSSAMRAEGLNELAKLRLAQSRPEEAERVIARALDYAEESGQPRIIAMTADSRGNILLDLQRLDEAEPLLLRALALRREHEENPAIVAETLMLLGHLELDRRHYDRALEYSLEVVQRQRAAHADEDHVDVAQALNNLGLAYLYVNEFELASRHILEALAIYRRTIVGPHPVIAAALQNLGGIAYRQENSEEAIRRFTEAVETYRQAYGHDHPRMVAALVNLALLEGERGDPERAEALFVRANRIFDETYPDGHPDAIAPAELFADLLKVSDRDDEAIVWYQRAAGLGRRFRGPDDRDAADCDHEISGLHLGRGDAAAALPYAERVLAVRSRILDEDDVERWAAHRNYGVCLARLGRLEEAQSHLLRYVEFLEELDELSGPLAGYRQACLSLLAQIYEKQGKPELAARFRERAGPAATTEPGARRP